MSRLAITVLGVFTLVVAAAGRADAVVILSTDLTGRTVSGSTASNITWTTNGVADPGNLTANMNPDGLFDTADAQGRFAVNRNIHNEGDWLTDITLAVQGAAIDLGTVTLDAFIYNNSGVLQGVQRDLDYKFDLLGPGMVLLDSVSVLNIYANSGTAVQPQNVSFDFSGNLLAANTTYTLRLTATGQGPGNNAGFDNPTVNGTVLPEPTTAVLGLLGAGALALRRRRAA